MILKKTWQALTSFKMALVLLILLTITIAAFTVYARNFTALADLLFGSGWFLLLCSLLFVNLLACTGMQLIRLAVNFRSMKTYGKIKRVGVLLFHLGLILIISGSFVKKAAGMSGFMKIAKGETRYETHNDYEVLEEGAYFTEARHRNFAMTLMNQKNVYGDRGAIKDIVSEFRIKDGAEVTTLKLGIFSPVEYKGVRFYFNKHGFAPKIRIAGEKGALLHETYLVVDTSIHNGSISFQTEGFAPAELPYAMDIDFYPNYPAKPEVPPYKLINPAMKVSVTNGQEYVIKDKVILSGEPLTFAGYKFSFGDVKPWTGVDIKRDPGEKTVAGGYILTLIGISLMYLVPLMRLDRGAVTSPPN